MTSLNETAGGVERVCAPGPAGAALAALAGNGEDAAGSAEDAGSCDTEGKATAKENKNVNKPTWRIRIKTFWEHLCQLENNMQDNGGIGWLAVPHRRLEMNLLGGLDGIVVEAVT